jgi:hypothetical protein
VIADAPPALEIAPLLQAVVVGAPALAPSIGPQVVRRTIELPRPHLHLLGFPPLRVGDPSAAPSAAPSELKLAPREEASSPTTRSQRRHRPAAPPSWPDPALPFGALGVLGALGASGSVGGGSSGGGAALAAALGSWLVFQLPALATWWVSLRQRFPRSRPGDIPERPG